MTFVMRVTDVIDLHSRGTAFFGLIAGQPHLIGPTDCILLIEGQRYMSLQVREEALRRTPPDDIRALSSSSHVDAERVKAAVVAGTCEIHEVTGSPA